MLSGNFDVDKRLAISYNKINDISRFKEIFIMKQYSFILIGAGGRGMTYTREMLKMPEKYKLVAMADPLDYKRERCMKEFGLSAEQCYCDWREILAKPK